MNQKDKVKEAIDDFLSRKGINCMPLLDEIDLIFGVKKLIEIDEVIGLVNTIIPNKYKKEGLKTKVRYSELMIYKQVTMFLLRKKGHSFQAIGEHFDNTHATVINNYNRVDKLLETKDERMCIIYEIVDSLIQSKLEKDAGDI